MITEENIIKNTYGEGDDIEIYLDDFGMNLWWMRRNCTWIEDNQIGDFL